MAEKPRTVAKCVVFHEMMALFTTTESKWFSLPQQAPPKQPTTAIAHHNALTRECLLTTETHTQTPFVQLVCTDIPEAASTGTAHCMCQRMLKTTAAHTQAPFVQLVRTDIPEAVSTGTAHCMCRRLLTNRSSSYTGPVCSTCPHRHP